MIKNARAGVESRGVETRGGRVWNRHGRLGVTRIVRRGRLRIFAVRLEEADVEKKRLRWAAVQISHRGRRHVRGTIALRLEKFVVSDALRFIGDVLQAAEHRLVT